MDHGNNQTRSAIPQAAWCQLNRGRIRRLLGWNKANTAFGANPNEETANRIKRLDETLGRKPSDHLTPEEKAQHNRYRGLEGKGTD